MDTIWTDEATLQIADIIAHIAKDSPYHAVRFTRQLMDSVEKQISVSARIGRQLPQANDPDLRLLTYRDYRIIYRVREDAAYIMLVEHGARELTKKRIQDIQER